MTTVLEKTRLLERLDERIQKLNAFSEHPESQTMNFFASRLQDLTDKSGNNVAVTLLAWDKPFDKINDDRLFEAVKRVGAPDSTMNTAQNNLGRREDNDCLETTSIQCHRAVNSSISSKAPPISLAEFISQVGCISENLRNAITKHLVGVSDAFC